MVLNGLFKYLLFCFFADETSGVVYTVELSKQGQNSVGIVVAGTREYYSYQKLLLRSCFLFSGTAKGLSK